jgi:hypothetical protein
MTWPPTEAASYSFTEGACQRQNFLVPSREYIEQRGAVGPPRLKYLRMLSNFEQRPAVR